MAIKKSALYASLWQSCDSLRGGMDASLYKDYVLTLLFVKYLSDKYANKPFSPVVIPEGASFEDMVALKGQPDIGDRINKEILQPLFEANELSDKIQPVDFNDDDKLGTGREKVDRLTDLIAVFENEALDFKNNRAEDDDILGDAYEFLMRNFATQSGKSKGQFYTPAEVSRVLSKVIEVHRADRADYTVYDPTCGSGSLLLKVVDEAPADLTLYGQEKDITTKGLAIMNTWLHGHPGATIAGKNTLSSPQFLTADGQLQRFDFVVANPPFSMKNWSTGLQPEKDQYRRFQDFGIPPTKNGDYAFLLHIVASLKSTGKAAVILPHGVLFRGNAEAEIRQNLIQRRWIKGIIGLPANLFYGTGIPACIIVLDKEGAEQRQGIFMVNAEKGYSKEGNKNRLRERDIHKIVDVFNKKWELPHYARLVPFAEIETNDYNLNLPRYIDTAGEEDRQDLAGHLQGGIPEVDVAALGEYWKVFPSLRKELFSALRPGYLQLRTAIEAVKGRIYAHEEFAAFQSDSDAIFQAFVQANRSKLLAIDQQTSPKQLIQEVSEDLLSRYSNRPLIVRYDMYQHLMDFWEERMKDDVYLIVEMGWKAEVEKSGTKRKQQWTCELLPKWVVENYYFAEARAAIAATQAELDSLESELSSLEEEHGGEDGLLSEASNDKGKMSKTRLQKALRDLDEEDPEEQESLALMQEAQRLYEAVAQLKKDIKKAEKELDGQLLQQYQALEEAEVKTLIIDQHWLPQIKRRIDAELERVSQALSQRIQELAQRYAQPLPAMQAQTQALQAQVQRYLEEMGLSVQALNPQEA